MKKFFVAVFVFVMMFGSINAFSEEQAEPEYNTSISGDIVLNFNDDWQPGFTIDSESLSLKESSITRQYFQVYANVHLKGNTDAKILRIQSAEVNTSMQEIQIDSNGNFDQEVKLILTSFNSTDSNIINFGAYVNAIKGDRTVKVKIGKGELKTNISFDADGDNDGITSIDFAEFRRRNLDYLQEEFGKMDKQETLKTYIYNEWYMKDFVMGKDGFSFDSQNHLKAKTNATKITLDINSDSKNEKFEYLLESTGEIDEIKEVSGVIPGYKSSNVAAYACVKAFKGNREMELGSTLRERKGGDAVVGDLNNDKSVNSVDFAILRKYIMGMIDRFPVQSGFYSADVNDDKGINSVDFAFLRMYLLGMINHLPKDSSTVIDPTPTNSTVSPTPVIPTPTHVTPTPNNGMVTYYEVNKIDTDMFPGVEIYVEKSPMSKIWISSRTVCRGPLYSDGWSKTYFTLSGNAVNGADYEKIDFGHFWREVGTGFNMTLEDNNPRKGFYITPIDTGSDETKDLEIYFGSSKEPAAIIHFVKSISNIKDEDRAKQPTITNSFYGATKTLANNVTQNSVEFCSQNFIADEIGNPTNSPIYYEPKNIFYMEKNVPSSLKVIKNPAICNLPLTIYNTATGLKPNTTYVYGNDIKYLTVNDNSASQESFTTLKD